MVPIMDSTAATPVGMRKKVTFFMLSKTTLPSLTALNILAKLSSVIIMSDASFATSVPVLPIAMPI